MSISTVKFLDLFGYHSPNRYKQISTIYTQGGLLGFNLLSSIVSPIIGVARVCLGATELLNNQSLTLDQRKFTTLQIVRGLGELLFLGPIFAGVDIIVTIYRIMTTQSQKEYLPI